MYTQEELVRLSSEELAKIAAVQSIELPEGNHDQQAEFIYHNQIAEVAPSAATILEGVTLTQLHPAEQARADKDAQPTRKSRAALKREAVQKEEDPLPTVLSPEDAHDAYMAERVWAIIHPQEGVDDTPFVKIGVVGAKFSYSATIPRNVKVQIPRFAIEVLQNAESPSGRRFPVTVF